MENEFIVEGKLFITGPPTIVSDEFMLVQNVPPYPSVISIWPLLRKFPVFEFKAYTVLRIMELLILIGCANIILCIIADTIR